LQYENNCNIKYSSSIDYANEKIVNSNTDTDQVFYKVAGAEITTYDTESPVTAVNDRDTQRHGVSKKGPNKSLCRFFAEGNCKHGKSCSFSHDPLIFCSKKNKVFLAGLPHCNSVELKDAFQRKGYVILNKLRIFENKNRYIPLVILKTEEMAKKLIEAGKIQLFNKLVDVRPYKEHIRMKRFDRCVFLGGLDLNTTREMIDNGL